MQIHKYNTNHICSYFVQTYSKLFQTYHRTRNEDAQQNLLVNLQKAITNSLFRNLENLGNV